MKPRRPVSMILLDVILTLWWILFTVMFFIVLVKTNRPTIRGFTAKGLIVIFNFLISEGEGWFRRELKVGRLGTSILLLFPTALTIWATHLYFDFFDYVDQYRWPCVKLSILTYFICLYINISPSVNEYLKNYEWRDWLVPWRNHRISHRKDSDEQN